ncbi:transcriptional regulator of multiple amino acid permease [Yamadazyma tenuis ATCC 10573]|uniref:Transcriptional regulator of multiple amino acid permease n=2 Tax=Candida tenuis TaxID=2315449 RepID=G3AXZ2_CANTC|nr:transcriptional regulator of multiple amino acid permease [Yamadazyma tenuis ATCC 10573]EGV65728.1 transcriptional regulator of multiple amino acid permease [Yamadazyma tenuis ATCC 10573]
MSSKNSSVFGLRNLDDFNRYVKSTELNDLIYEKYSGNLSTQDNLLDIIKSKDLEQNFYIDNNDIALTTNNDARSRIGTITNSRRWYNIDWKVGQKGNGEGNIAKSSDLYLGDESPVSTSSEEALPRTNRYLSRKLKVRNLQMISFGGTLGVGLFLNSGKAITIAGGFGTLLAFIICGIIVLSTIISFCEMVTFVSIVDGVSGLSSRFVDDAFGFAVGWLYFLSFAFGLAGEMVASVIMLTYYPELKILENKGSVAGFVVFFLLSVIISNSINVQIFGEVEYISSFIKLIFVLVMIVIMIVMNRGGFGGEVLGFKYWDHSRSDFDNNIIFGLFRPSFNLQDTGMSDPSEGIGGSLGNFMSLMVAISVVSFAYSGTEIVCIAACEAKDPRKALPSATKRVFWRIVIFYCLSAFVVSLNLYAGDPRLLRYFTGSTGVASADFNTNYAIQYVGGTHCDSKSAIYAGYSSGAQSPWIVALQTANLCQFSSVANGFLVFFAVSCGNAQLYVSSRTMYSLSLQGKAPKFFSICNRHGIPYYSVAFAASFGLLAFLCVSEEATVVFSNLSNIIASSGIIVWFAMCLSFIRFYYGLKKRPDIISRDDPSYPYKSFFQPYSAFIGLIGSAIIILTMGYTVFLNKYWDTMSFFASYGTLIIFAVCYIVYKFIYGTRIRSLETLDFDSGRREMDRFIWDGNKDYNKRSLKEVLHKWVSFLA